MTNYVIVCACVVLLFVQKWYLFALLMIVLLVKRCIFKGWMVCLKI